ncbi:MAG: DUF4230 domain-containing protein [Ardenticatenales bacterium]|nr:DUF4230 domain-containing protein [Ardenticatenales bacterium]
MTTDDPSEHRPPTLRSTPPRASTLSRQRSPEDDVPHASRLPRTGRSWPVIAAAVFVAGVGAILVVAALILYGLYRRGDAFLDDVSNAFSPRPNPTPALTAKAVIVERLQEAAELTTMVYTLETVVSESQSREIGGFTIGSTELLYIANGQVRAGVDLSKLREGDLDIERRSGEPFGPEAESVTVELPAPEILGAALDVERSRVYDLRRSLFGPVDPDLQSRAERYALTRIVEGACEADVLAQANERASTAVRAVLEAAGAGDVTVRTRPPGPCRWPPTPP